MPDSPTPRPTGDLEHLFRQKFAEAEVAPRASFWDQLDHELVVQQHEQVVQENTVYRRRLVLHRWAAAACLLLALGFGSWAFLGPNGFGLTPELATTLPAGSAREPSGGFGQNPATSAGGLTERSTTTSEAGYAANQPAGTTNRTANESSALANASATASRAGMSGLLADLYESVMGGSGRTAPQAARYGTQLAAARPYAPGQDGSGSAAGLFAAQFAGLSAAANEQDLFTSFSLLEPRAAYLRSQLGLRRPDTLKPALLPLPVAPENLELLAAAPEPERHETPKLWKRLRVGGSYAAGAFNPNINFSRTDARAQDDPVTNALRSYYQEEAETEYRRHLRAGLSQRVALTASYALNKHWTLTAGAEAAEHRATSATTYGFLDGKQVGREAAGLFSRPAAYSPAPTQPRATAYRYRSVTVPVGVSYGSAKTGVSLYAKVGAAVSVLLNSRAELDGSPEATRAYTAKSADSPYRQVLTSLRGGTGVRYQPASSTWSVAVGPVAETYLTTLNANPSQRMVNQSRPYSLGLEASVEFGSAKPMPGVQ